MRVFLVTSGGRPIGIESSHQRAVESLLQIMGPDLRVATITTATVGVPANLWESEVFSHGATSDQIDREVRGWHG